ncbi:hypothetical protein CEXT_749701 [Caerostris extrusa]|uniref:Uncharacterized protein n=1 Tax=Caerostris extrusa TaxID=172846 RepID=A0AAV4PPZ6_CAEEX|nr:hypothetical protein CEXT_749701 [Caerostris extrusa]
MAINEPDTENFGYSKPLAYCHSRFSNNFREIYNINAFLNQQFQQAWQVSKNYLALSIFTAKSLAMTTKSLGFCIFLAHFQALNTMTVGGHLLQLSVPILWYRQYGLFSKIDIQKNH